MTSELRPAALVAHEVCEEMEEYGPTFAERVIKADRQQAVAAEVAQIVAWLNSLAILRAMQNPGTLAQAIERGEYKETSGE